MQEEPQDLPSSLVVVMDMCPKMWAASRTAGGPDVTEVAETLLTFIRAFLLLHADNSVSFIAADSREAKMLYSPELRARRADTTRNLSCVLEMDSIDFDLHRCIVEFSTRCSQTTAPNDDEGNPAPLLSSALAIAACYCNQLTGGGIDLHRTTIPRVLVISATSEFAGQYVSLMNCFFSFEKSGILVDT